VIPLILKIQLNTLFSKYICMITNSLVG